VSQTTGIDIQSHFLPASYAEAATREAAEDSRWASSHGVLTVPPTAPIRRLDGRVQDMLGAGIRLAIVSVPAAIFRVQARAIDASRESNSDLVELASADRDHFRVLASLPMPFVAASLKELERISGQPLVAGIIMPAGAADWSLDDGQFQPIYAAASAAGLPIMLHPSLEPAALAFQRWALAASVAVPVETSMAALRLMLSGVLDDHPDLSIIVPHLGGVLPYLTQRLLDQTGRGDAKYDVGYYLRHRVFYDNCSFHQPALMCAVETVGADRIMLGSDYPFRGQLSRCVSDVLDSVLSQDQQKSIISGTAESVMRNLADGTGS